MIPNPILKVLSTLSCHEVRHLLMGGQACVFYGAAEFSRDCDIVVLADETNLANLAKALEALQAECIALPEFKAEFLQRGHAIHFRCWHPDAARLRLDVMTKMRGCDEFEPLWNRRTSIEDPEANVTYELLGIDDLVRAKKTQRDKDWPMIRRLVEAHYDQRPFEPTADVVRFWLRESRTPAMLAAVARSYPEWIKDVISQRPWLLEVDLGDAQKVEEALRQEEMRERSLDVEYWRPLKQELIEMRRRREPPAS